MALFRYLLGGATIERDRSQLAQYGLVGNGVGSSHWNNKYDG
ncbi:MAG: hypothetical protein WCI20_08885 [bacterium]